MIIALGQFVLEEACRSARAWQDVGPRRRGHRRAREPLRRRAARPQPPGHRRRPRWSSPASTPTCSCSRSPRASLQDAESSQAALRALRGLGVRLALDDFGTGYSSLSYLRELPLDILKIAKPFVEGMARGSQESSFARMIIDLARALDLHVVAEGIESAEELEALQELHCELGPGLLPGEAAGARRGAQGPQPVRPRRHLAARLHELSPTTAVVLLPHG